MASPSLRNTLSQSSARRRRPTKSFRLRFEPLEGRIAPALFTVQTPFSPSGASNNGSVAVADFNKDGLSDAVLTNFGTDYGSGAGKKITLLRRTAAGSFDVAQAETGGSNVSFASVGDINGDTWPDLIVANANNQNQGSISVFSNDGAGNLSLVGTPFSSFGNNASWVGLADVTGDDVLDAIVANFGKDDGSGENFTGNKVTIFQGNGDFTFSSSPVTTLAPEIQFVPIALAVTDLDGDGINDIAAVSPGIPPDFGQDYPNGTVYVFKGNGSGGFSNPNQYDSGGAFPVSIQAADLNGNGKKDLVIANVGNPNGNPEFSNDSVGVLLNVSNVGNINFGFPNSLTTNTYGTFAVAVADFDLDGKKDIAAVNYGSQLFSPAAFVSVYMGNGSGSFSPGNPGTYDTLTNFGGGQFLAVGDFDANGTPDLIVAHATNKVGVLLNTTVAAPSVTINQASGQPDPTNGSSIVYDVVFSEGVSGFDQDDIVYTGSTIGGLSASVTANSATSYTVTITGMNGTGLVKVSIPAGAATSTAGSVASLASTSTDNQVTFDNVSPTVTINQASGQADPASSGPILYTVVFSEAVTGFTTGDVDLSDSSLTGLSATVTQNTASNYTVSVTGMSANGTVVAKLLAGVATDATGNPSAASTSSDNSVTYNPSGAPTVTINQAVGQADPTNASPILFTVHFDQPVTGFDGNDIQFTGSTVGGSPVASVIGAGQDYTVSVTGMSGTGLVKASIPAGAALSTSGSVPSLASTSTDNEVAFDNVSPSVTINQAIGQDDPALTGPILYTVVFSEPVTGFGSGDVDLSASSLTGLSASVTQNTPSNYTVSVSGMSGSGTVVAKVIAGAAFDAANNASTASTSTDNTVTFAPSVAPTVTINQGSTQADPTNSAPVLFDVHFDQDVTGFDGSDVLFTGSTVGGTLSASVSGSGQDYVVTVTGMTGTGLVVASIPAGAAINLTGTQNTASTSTDNSVTFDGDSPTVTIDQGASQSDPTSVSSIVFDVVFSEPVTGFDETDVSLLGSTVGGTLSVTVTGSLDTYSVTVTGMTTGGVVIASIPADAAVDAVGNSSLASSSTDNLVEFQNLGTLGFTQAVYNTTEDGTVHSVTITVTRGVQTDGAVSIDYSTSDGTAHSGGPVATGQDDYTPVSGTLEWADGVGGDKSFTIPILPDTLNEGQELINLLLSNPMGSPILERTTAEVAIAPNDGEGQGVYFDQDGDKYRIRLKGKTGAMQFFRTDPDGDGTGPIELIEVINTDPNPLRPRATLSISVKKSRNTTTDGGTVGIGAITGSGLKRIIAGKANLDGKGINLDGYLGFLRIGNIVNGADITTKATTNPKQKTSIRALTILDGTDIDVGAHMRSLIALSFGDGSLTTPSIGKIGIRGNLAADLNISGVGVPSNRKTVGLLRVREFVTGSDIYVGGNMGAAVVGAFRDSRLFVGYTGPDNGLGGDFNFPATLKKFRSTEKVDSFQNSWVIASFINSVTIRSLDSTNDEKFGFYANSSVRSLRVNSPEKFKFDPTLAALQGVDDFEVRIV